MSLTIFSLEGSKLLNCEEAHNPIYCEGLPNKEYCGEEIFCEGDPTVCDGDIVEPGKKMCTACRHEAERQEQRAEDERDWEEEILNRSQYRHLRDEDEEARLREAVAKTEHISLPVETLKKDAA